MKAYLDIVKKVLNEGSMESNRTGIDALTIPSAIFEHDMSDGFPLLTSKTVPLRLVASELEFFIKGLTDKEWLRSRNNHIWDDWCNPSYVKYGHDDDTKAKMKEERDLGPVYGWQWRYFGAKYPTKNKPYNYTPFTKGIDQLKNVVETLKNNPQDRRMIVSAWNPVDFNKMALPPCHYAFQVSIVNNKLHLSWNQRSIDLALGLPFNISSYGLLLHLLAKESGFEEGKLTGFLANTHIYSNHIDNIKLQLDRELYKLPQIETKNFKSIFSWEYQDTKVINYKHHPKISFEIAV